MDIKEFPKELDKIQSKYKFAGVMALTWTARDARDHVRKILPKRFTIRNRFVVQGIKFQGATKQKVEAKVYSKDWFMADQETGASRSPATYEYDNRFWIPQRGLYTYAKAKRGKQIPKRLTPPKIMKQKIKGQPPFIVEMKNGITGVFVRRTKERYPIVLLYRLYDKNIRIKQRPFFRRSIEKIYKKNIHKNFKKGLKKLFKIK